MKCRHCGSELKLPFVDLGSAPPSNAYLCQETLRTPETWFPLRVLVCEQCWLVQTEDFARAEELFSNDYAYFSGFSSSWLEHCERYVGEMVKRFSLNQDSHVVEIAANDGSLLQYVQAQGIPCTGVEPTSSTATAARVKGIHIIEEFFGRELANTMAEQGMQADLITANNVLAHVPDINDFVNGIARLLKVQGVVTFEFPHLLKLVEGIQFDTIYHEHFSYLSLIAVEHILADAGLTIFDVVKVPTHGGSLRVFSQKTGTNDHSISSRVQELRDLEIETGLNSARFYAGFQQRVDKIKNDLLSFLITANRDRKKVAAYGAAAKGNTMLNYAGIRSDLLPYVVDKNPEKQGKFLPGSRIPIMPVEVLRKDRPDYVLILPWNLKEEVISQIDFFDDWGGKWVVAVPDLEIL